ncbi:MAG TPA: DUF2203 domain-containing protein [Granulicella sp.]
MSKTFTLHEATTLLPVLESLLRRAQETARRAGRFEHEMDRLTQQIHLTGGMRVDVVSAARNRAERDKAAQQAKDLLTEIEEIGVTVQDLEIGLLDFPCQIEGSTVFLCWRLGEPAITHWHTSEEGYAGRRPLDARFGPINRERPN